MLERRLKQTGLFTGHGPAHGSGHDVFQSSRVGSGRVGSGRVRTFKSNVIRSSVKSPEEKHHRGRLFRCSYSRKHQCSGNIFFFFFTRLPSSFWTSRRHRCRLFSAPPPPVLASIFISSRAIGFSIYHSSACSSIFHRVFPAKPIHG